MTQTITNNVMIGLLGAVGLILLYLLFLAARKPVLVKIGLRNLPRRPAQSVLIVIGLTLSTVIILSSLAIGDTLTYSVRSSAVQAYGRIDEIIAPPLLSLLATLGNNPGDLEAAAAENEQMAELTRLTEGGLTSLLAVLEGGLPGITEERLDVLKLEAAHEPLIDAVAGSILFPTIIRNRTTGQGEPLGFIFAVDNDYDQLFGLTAIDGAPVEMEALQTGVGNIFGQASRLFGLLGGMIGDGVSALGLPAVNISDVALATAAVGAALTGASGEAGLDLASLTLDIATLKGLGVDTTFLEAQGITEISLESLGITPDLLTNSGVTTTVTVQSVGINSSAMQTTTNQLLAALNLNTLGQELDRVLAQAGLQLRQGDLYLSRLGAQQLDARVGDVLEVYIGPLPLPFRVKAIVDQAGPMSAIAPVVMLRLDETQKLLFMNGRVNNILVSNQGDEMEGIDQTAAVNQRLRILALDPVLIETITEILHRPAVRAILAANVDSAARDFTNDYEGPEFLRPIFAELAGASQALAEALVAELENGFDNGEETTKLRALLADMTLRTWLSNQSLAPTDQADLDAVLGKLNRFDLLDPLNKQTVVSLAEVGGTVFATIFSVFGILSIIAGVLLIFLIFVMMAAERRSEMGMARAIGVQRSHVVQMFVTEGVVYDLLAATLGVLLGLAISYAIVGFIGPLFNSAAEQLTGQAGIFQIYFRAAPTSIVIAYCLGVLFTFVVVTLASWRVSRLNIVAAIRDLEEPPGPGRTSRLGRTARLLFGPLLAGLGALLIYQSNHSLDLMQAGASLLIASLAYLAGWFMEQRAIPGERVQRIVYSLIGGGLLATWALPWGAWLPLGGSDLAAGDSWFLLRFILGAPLLILGAIALIMFNAATLAWAVSRLLRGLGFLTPVLRTAIAYPLSSRFRTGMTMILFAMIITTVTLMTVVIEATQTLVTPDSERYAEFEIGVYNGLLSFFDPLEDLEAELPTKSDFPLEDVAVVGSVAGLQVDARQLTPSAAADVIDRTVKLAGLNNGYLAQAEQVYGFSRRAEGYANDSEIWAALRTRDDVAVVTTDLLTRDAGDPAPPTVPEDPLEAMIAEVAANDFSISIPIDGTSLLPEIRLSLRSGEQPGQTVQVIGVIAQAETLAGSGIWLSRAALTRIAGEVVYPDAFYIKVAEEADAHTVAQAAERSFLNNAVNATVLAESFAQGQALTRGILQLFQGFMGLGLLVGIAALGVISTRTVVERRQQVGMLRAIGFQPYMVALTFLLESSFIALTGIGVGASVGTLLGEALVSTSYETLVDGSLFNMPWAAIGLIVLIAYGSSLFTTILPALQASRIYPAEALRYE